jgi:hypothetical protein
VTSLPLLWFGQYSVDRQHLTSALTAGKASLCPQAMRYRTSRSSLVGSLGHLSEQGESCVGIEPMNAEVVETVAGVARLLRRAAEQAWMQADEGDPRSSHQLLALGIDTAADEASGLLLRRGRFDGPTPVGDHPGELLTSAEQRLRPICAKGAPSQLLGLRALVAGSSGRRTPVPAPDRRTVGELLVDSDALAREIPLNVIPAPARPC